MRNQALIDDVTKRNGTLSEIARKHGCSKQNVQQLAKRIGVDFYTLGARHSRYVLKKSTLKEKRREAAEKRITDRIMTVSKAWIDSGRSPEETGLILKMKPASVAGLISKLRQKNPELFPKQGYRKRSKSRGYCPHKFCAHVEAFKKKCRSKTHVLIRGGLLLRKPCVVCGERAVAHHPDYTDHTRVEWLCSTHHKEVHKPLSPAFEQTSN